MSTKEFKEQFDLLYDNISSNEAPGLDDYEISVFLTYAQEELIKNKDNPKSNRLQDGFEKTDKRRIDLKDLIRDFKGSDVVTLNNKGIHSDSKFFRIPSDVFLIKNESAIVEDKVCGDVRANVVPKTHDEFNIQIDNPFKKPSKKTVWRLDYNSIEPGQNVVELISDQNIKQYNIRYIKRANPIILSDLDTGEFAGSGLTILGQTKSKTSELDPSVHSEIVRRAVELATLAYKENNLSNVLSLYQRKE